MQETYPYETRCCFADVPVLVRHTYDYFPRFCRDYLTDQPPELTLTVTPENIALERSRAEECFPDSMLESTAVFRLFCQAVAIRGILMLHACTVEADGRAYAFVAPSGTGKSTHATLWLQLLGRQRARILNGDKPLLRVEENGQTTAYGTPWSGKERLHVAASAPLAGICLLDRGEKNSIRRLSFPEAIPHLIAEAYRTETAEGASAVMDSLVRLAGAVPVYTLACNISEEAARLSYETMAGKH